jgi:taurine dioxygenase
MTDIETFSPQEYRGIEVSPIAGAIGAEIRGVDLTYPMDDPTFAALRQAFLDHLVIFLPQTKTLDPHQLKAFAGRFGSVDEAPFVHPIKMPSEPGHPEVFNVVKESDHTSINVGGFWHADVTYRERPHLGAVLYAKDAPSYGGDTMFANQYLAYETLPDDMKQRLLAMRAIHSSAMPYGRGEARFGAVGSGRAPSEADRAFAATGLDGPDANVIETLHPVIRTHPDTGRKALYVNRAFTSRFDGMSMEDSLPLLDELWHHAARPEFTCRYRWTTNAVALWDNRVTQHYAINDYFGQRRHMQRIAIHEASRPA